LRAKEAGIRGRGSALRMGRQRRHLSLVSGERRDDVDVEDVMSENVEDSDDVLEPDDGDRSDTIIGGH
jgi:hypothetical protein